MAGQALYRRWRSQTFEDVIGQEHVGLTLRNALRDGHQSHAYLFAGPRGTGKTSTARILAKALNCLADDPAARPCNQCRICTAITDGSLLDLIEIDAASNRGIDEIRELREKIGFKPGEARYKVYIVDEVHMLTKEAFNALLKTLEEPPPHAVFVLATTEPDRVPETVRSRCQRFDFRRIPAALIQQHLAEILAAEGGRAAPEALAAIARRATGSMRDAISLLDQLLSYGDDVISLERVSGVLGLVDAQMIGGLVDTMAAHDAAAGLKLINQMVAEGVDLGQLVDQILGYLRSLLFVQVTHAPDSLELSQEVAAAIVRQAEALPVTFALAAIREFLEARGALREQVPGVPQLPIELAFLRAALVAAQPASPVSAAPEHPAAILPTPVDAHPAVQTAPSAPQARRAAAEPAARPSGAMAPGPRPTEREQHAGERETGQPAGTPGGAARQEGTPAAVDAGLLKTAQQNWDRFLALAGKRCGIKVKAALQSVRMLDVAGSALVLQFAHEFSRGVVNEGENRRQVEAVWEEVLGRRVQVRCTVAGEKAPQPRAAVSGSDDEDFLQGARDLGAEIKRLE